MSPVCTRTSNARRLRSRWQDSACFKAQHEAGRLGVTSGLGSLPDYLIIGAQRSGTTSLYSYLSEHPDLVPALTKEVHYFDNHYSKGLDWYKAFFPLQLAFTRGEHSGLSLPIRGEATPYYLFHPDPPRRIASVLPHVKLVAWLRNPIDRAYSHYQHEVRLGYEHFRFEGVTMREAERTDYSAESTPQDPWRGTCGHQHLSYLSRGIYHHQLRRYLDLFGRDSLMVPVSERLFSAPQEITPRILQFVGMSVAKSQRASFPKKQFHGTYEPLSQATRARLIDYFGPHNLAPSRLFDIEPDWDK